VGIGDDAAVLDIDGIDLVVTTDILAAGTHFPPGTSPEQMARKAVVANFSDLAAMGAKPLAILFSIAFPKDLKLSFVRRLLKSMDSVAREYGAFVVGGDLDESGEIVVAGTALGLVRKGRSLTRSGAKVGDLVAVTGTLGKASAGLKILLEKLPRRGFHELVRAQLEPRARVREGGILAENSCVTAAIDLSDGLASDLWQLAKASTVKIIIERESIPADPLVIEFSREYGFDPDNFVLYGGEDFELLFTVKAREWRKIFRAFRKKGMKITPVGRVVRGKGVYIRVEGKTQPLPDRGYEHYK
jgi:thiamine-monophosphate kinase